MDGKGRSVKQNRSADSCLFCVRQFSGTTRVCDEALLLIVQRSNKIFSAAAWEIVHKTRQLHTQSMARTKYV